MIILLYILGFLVTLFVLSRYGKTHFGFDYDKPRTYANYDDWSSNAQAFTAWSLGWPVFVSVHLILFLFKKLTLLYNIFK